MRGWGIHVACGKTDVSGDDVTVRVVANNPTSMASATRYIPKFGIPDSAINWGWRNLTTPGALGMADEESQTYAFTVTYHLSG